VILVMFILYAYIRPYQIFNNEIVSNRTRTRVRYFTFSFLAQFRSHIKQEILSTFVFIPDDG
jgi:hypothetical protein